MPRWNARSMVRSNSVTASTGVASTCTTLVAYVPHTNSGSRRQCRPGARMVWMVVTKLTPVRMDEKPRMKTPSVVEMTDVSVLVLYGV
jgi:hypothetical protein